jgi:protein-tyrosine phosphatase
MRTVLFLCTGNYYRSRFAEELFNHRAAHMRMNWQAQSRALAMERGKNNVGPISPFVLRGLETRGIVPKGASRLPQECSLSDLGNADCIVALNEAEHRPLMRERFSDWESRTRYWGVEDVKLASPRVALSIIDVQMDTLLSVLINLKKGARDWDRRD